MAAEVGIGPFRRRFRNQIAICSELFNRIRSLLRHCSFTAPLLTFLLTVIASETDSPFSMASDSFVFFGRRSAQLHRGACESGQRLLANCFQFPLFAQADGLTLQLREADSDSPIRRLPAWAGNGNSRSLRGSPSSADRRLNLANYVLGFEGEWDNPKKSVFSLVSARCTAFNPPTECRTVSAHGK